MHLINAGNIEPFVCENSDRLTMLHFRAEWNPLDEPMCLVTEEVDAAVGDQLAVAEVDVTNPENAELLEHLGLTHIPALIFVFRNRVVDYKVGYSKVRLVGHVQQLLQRFSPFSPDPPIPVHPGPFPSGIVLPPPIDPNSPTEEPTSHSGNTDSVHSGMTGPPMSQPDSRDQQKFDTQGFPIRIQPLNGPRQFGGPPLPNTRLPNTRPQQQHAMHRPRFGLIPHQLRQEEPKKSWWSRLLG